MAKNKNLIEAKKNKNDEFYTQYKDIEAELNHQEYKDFFKGKIVYCNCDTEESNFVKFFNDVKDSWEIKEVIYSGKEDGGFQGHIDLLKYCDVVVSNPPFSLFREYIALLIQHNKKFVIIGNGNAITYKEIFPLIKDNKMWIGASKGIGGKMLFKIPDSYQNKFVITQNGERFAQVNSSCWFTNINLQKNHQPLLLCKEYYGNEKDYPKYDNYDAINCDKTVDIPKDYFGVIGVPISFLDKYCVDQFEIVSFRKGTDGKDLVYSKGGSIIQPYFRILIQPHK